jgi:AcrR family transcriptional regulator
VNARMSVKSCLVVWSRKVSRIKDCLTAVWLYSVKSVVVVSRASASRRSGSPAQRPLNRDVILDGAIALIEREGSSALSMRRLGARLGVEGMAIYHHFDSREELLNAIGERLLRSVQELELGDDWREACRRFATAMRDLALAQPATFQLLGLQPFDTPTSLQPVERLLRVLIAEGFSPGVALGIYRATVSYARGYALAEATGFTVDAARSAGRGRLAMLPVAEFPVLGGRAGELAELDADAGWELGLEALLTGLAGRDPVKPAGRGIARGARCSS